MSLAVKALLAVVVFFSCPRLVRAILEDEAGVLDFRKQHLGQIGSVHAASGNSLLVASQAAVVASVHTNNGSFAWRHVLGETDTIKGALGVSKAGLLTLSGPTHVARFWDRKTGSLLWDHATQASQDNSPASCVGLSAANDQSTLFAATGSKVSAFDTESGVTVWEWTADAADSLIAEAAGSDAVAVVTAVQPLTKARAVAAGYLAKAPGKPADHIFTIELPDRKNFRTTKVHHLPADACVLLSALHGGPEQGWVASVRTKDGTVATLNAASGHSSDLDLKGVSAISTVADGQLLQVHSSSGSAVAAVSLQSSGKKTALQTLVQCADGSDCVVGAGKDESGAVFAVKAERTSPGGSHMSVQIVASNQSEGAQGSSADRTYTAYISHAERGPLKAAYLGAQDSSVVLVSADDSVLLVKSSDSNMTVEPAWVREEALAAITGVDFADTELSGRSTDHHAPSLTERLQMHVTELSEGVKHAVTSLGGILNGKEDPAQTKKGIPQSHLGFGLSKLALTTTRSGKLCALSTLTGDIVWSKLLPVDQLQSHTLFVTRPRGVLGYVPEFVLLSKSGDKTTLEWFEALTGEPVQNADKVVISNGGGITQVLPVDRHDDEGRQLLMLVSKDKTVRIVPEPSSESAATALQSLYHHHIDDAGLTAYAVITEDSSSSSSNSASGAGPKAYKSIQVGALSWGSDQKVVTVAYPSMRELVPTTAAVLGDDSLLLKYLNPHLAVVATIPSSATDADIGVPLTLWLVDTVSGRVLNRIEHEGASATSGVHCTVSEHNVVCAHWSTKARRTEVTSISLYEGMLGRYGVSPLKQPERHSTFSSFDDLPPIALHRTYLLPHAVTGVATSLTAHGITAKNVLFALKEGQIVSIDRRFLDPRRPTNAPSKAEIEEKLLQYSPFLPIIRASFITYGQEIAGVRSMATSPTNLESTSMLFAYGLDVFCTRLTPSNTFDLLASTFNYGLLLTVVVALIAGNIVTGLMASRKALRAQWA